MIYKDWPISAPYSCGSCKRIAEWAISARPSYGVAVGTLIGSINSTYLKLLHNSYKLIHCGINMQRPTQQHHTRTRFGNSPWNVLVSRQTDQFWPFNPYRPVLQLSGGPVAKCDLRNGRATQMLWNIGPTGNPRISFARVHVRSSQTMQPCWTCGHQNMHIFFPIFLCWTTQNLCGPSNVPIGWSAGWPRVFRWAAALLLTHWSSSDHDSHWNLSSVTVCTLQLM